MMLPVIQHVRATIPKAQKLLNSLEKAALKVSFRINQSNSEYILVGDWGDKNQEISKSAQDH
jgi:hypothetical protein